MSGQLMLLISSVVLMTSPWSNVQALPRMTTRQLAPALVSGITGGDNVCKNYMESCVPWETQCCNKMECMNLARGYCLYPLEKCLCQKTYVDLY